MAWIDTILDQMPQGEEVRMIRDYGLADPVDYCIDQILMNFNNLMRLVEMRVRERAGDGEDVTDQLKSLKAFLAADIGASCFIRLLNKAPDVLEGEEDHAIELTKAYGILSRNTLMTRFIFHAMLNATRNSEGEA